jgi:hypothetical protein
MIKTTNNLLFATIDSIPIIDKKQAASEILALDDCLSFWDEYRNTKMFPLMTKGGIGRAGTTNLQLGDFDWVEHTPKIIVDWFEDYIFPWIGSRARVMALVTQPGVANHEHIDCSTNELNTKQHKFRVVLQGKTDTLYWLTDKGKVSAPSTDKPFIMDGGWPHGMINNTDEVKVTLALGAPWTGKDSYDDITLLQDRTYFNMPDDITHLWYS